MLHVVPSEGATAAVGNFLNVSHHGFPVGAWRAALVHLGACVNGQCFACARPAMDEWHVSSRVRSAPRMIHVDFMHARFDVYTLNRRVHVDASMCTLHVHIDSNLGFKGLFNNFF